jgi:cytochrome c oxidase assembly protein subunit 15
VLAVLAWCGWRLRQQPGLVSAGQWLLGLLALQLVTGLSNVVFEWPLLAAVLHTGGAAAMVVTLTWALGTSRAEFSSPSPTPSRPAA